MKNLWEGIKKLWKCIKGFFGIDSGEDLVKWSLFIYGLACFVLSIIHYDMDNEFNAFVYTGGFSFAIWMLVCFGADKGYKIIMGLVAALVWALVFTISLNFSMPLLYWSSDISLSLMDKIKSFIGLGFASIFFYIFLHFMRKLFKKLYDGSIKKLAGQSQDISGAEKAVAFLGSLVGILASVISIFSAIIAFLK